VTPEYAPVADTVPGFDVSSWFAFFVSSKTPPAIVAKLAADTRAAVADKQVQDKLMATGAIPVGGTPEELAAFLKSEMKTWGDLIKEGNIKAE
jgi:tripartite-type tricarboxylate transporter receptor subunit TctC